MLTPETNSAVPLKIEKLVYGGDGLARHDGRVVLTPFTLPGELVEADLSRMKNDLLVGTVREIKEPSPERTTPPCPYFQRCGGCHLQHASYEYQVSQKVETLREVLKRMGKIDAPVEIHTVTGPPLGYRNRSQFHLGDEGIGYLAAGSHDLVSIDHCPISSPKINSVLKALRAMQNERRFPHFVRELEVFTDETSVQLNVLQTDRPVAQGFFDWCRERIPGLVTGALTYPVAGDSFRVSYRAFFQVNRFLLEPLVEEALWNVSGELAFDLYAGVGLFSLPLKKKTGWVLAVESSGAAIRDLEANAPHGVEVVRGSADQFLAKITDAPDFLLADPPRAGLQKEVVQELVRLKPQRLTIVSCDPSTLARDLAKLIEGGYKIARLSMVDLFPQTYHLETVAHLQLR